MTGTPLDDRHVDLRQRQLRREHHSGRPPAGDHHRMLGHGRAAVGCVDENVRISLLHFRRFWLAAGEYGAGPQTSRRNFVRYRLEVEEGIGTFAQESPGPLSRSPAGISFWQVISALLYCEEPVFTREPTALNVTVPFWNTGSGNAGTPCERMHATPWR